MDIELKEEGSQTACYISSDTMDLTIREAFNGVLFETSDGEKLGVSMRDSGFEVHYFSEDISVDHGWVTFNNGQITKTRSEVRPYLEHTDPKTSSFSGLDMGMGS